MIYQKFNKKTDAWVKFKQEKGKTKIINVKQRNPTIPFADCPIKR